MIKIEIKNEKRVDRSKKIVDKGFGEKRAARMKPSETLERPIET